MWSCLNNQEVGLEAKDANGQVKDTATLVEDIKKKLKGKDLTAQMSFLSRLGMDRTLVEMLTSDVSDLENEYNKMYKIAGINATEAAQAAAVFMDRGERPIKLRDSWFSPKYI